MNRVPANQPVSFTTYLGAINTALPVPKAFISAHLDRISNAFDMGEPIAMIIDELKLRWQITRGKWQKTPRQLAARVVR
jgi:hypothetical protein